MTDVAQPAARREVFSWCLFDFANSAFNTVVVTFVYSTFFAKYLVGNQDLGDRYWARALTVTGLVVAILSPFLGSTADRAARKRRYMMALSLVTIVCTALLWLPGAEGEPVSERSVWLALVLFTVANVAFEMAFVFYNAFLPQLGTSETIGRISGNAWAFGYVGGLLCMGLCWAALQWLPNAGFANVRATNLIVAGWFLVFSIPTFLYVKDRALPQGEVAPRPRSPLREVWQTLKGLRGRPDLARLLVAHLIYNDALMALITLAGLYMAGTLGMSQDEILLMGIWFNIAAGLGALGFGFVDDFLGAKKAIAGSLVLLIVGSVLAVAVPTAGMFWFAGSLVGIGMGPNQSASRSLMARFVDQERSAELYGLFALSGKATVWIGPLLFERVLDATHDQRLALTPLIGMFALGLVLILTVDERRGRARAMMERA